MLFSRVALNCMIIKYMIEAVVPQCTSRTLLFHNLSSCSRERGWFGGFIYILWFLSACVYLFSGCIQGIIDVQGFFCELLWVDREGGVNAGDENVCLR